MKQKIRNLADPEQVKQQEEQSKEKLRTELADIKLIMGTQHGRRFFYRLLASCKMYSTSFTGNSETFFNEGMRNVGLRLMDELDKAAPEEYDLMMAEARTAKKKETI